MGAGVDWLGLHWPTPPPNSEAVAALIGRVNEQLEAGADPVTGVWHLTALMCPCCAADNPRSALSPNADRVRLEPSGIERELDDNQGAGENPGLGLIPTGHALSQTAAFAGELAARNAAAGVQLGAHARAYKTEVEARIKIARGVDGYVHSIVLLDEWRLHIPSLHGLTGPGAMGLLFQPPANWLASYGRQGLDPDVVIAYAESLLRTFLCRKLLHVTCQRCGTSESEHGSRGCPSFDPFNVNRLDCRFDQLVPGLPPEITAIAERHVTLGDLCSATKMPKTLKRNINRYLARHPEASGSEVRISSPIVSRARTREGFKMGESLGLRIGKADVVARFYDKLQEALADNDLPFWLASYGLPEQKKRQKTILPPRWGKQWTVMRTEFQLRKRYLAGYGPLGCLQCHHPEPEHGAAHGACGRPGCPCRGFRPGDPLTDRTVTYVLTHLADYVLPLVMALDTSELVPVPASTRPFGAGGEVQSRVYQPEVVGEVLERQEMADHHTPWLGFYGPARGKEHKREPLPWWAAQVDYMRRLASECSRCGRAFTAHDTPGEQPECPGFFARLAGDGAVRDADRIRSFDPEPLLPQLIGTGLGYVRRRDAIRGEPSPLEAAVRWDPVRGRLLPVDAELADEELRKAVLSAANDALDYLAELPLEDRLEKAVKYVGSAWDTKWAMGRPVGLATVGHGGEE